MHTGLIAIGRFDNTRSVPVRLCTAELINCAGGKAESIPPLLRLTPAYGGKAEFKP